MPLEDEVELVPVWPGWVVDEAPMDDAPVEDVGGEIECEDVVLSEDVADEDVDWVCVLSVKELVVVVPGGGTTWVDDSEEWLVGLSLDVVVVVTLSEDVVVAVTDDEVPDGGGADVIHEQMDDADLVFERQSLLKRSVGSLPVSV